MLKRGITLVLALSLVATLLAGCGGDGDKKNGDGNLVTLKAWSSGVHNEKPIKEYVAKMNETKFKEKGFQVQYEVYGNDYGKTLDMAIASDQAPDLFSGSITQYANKKQLIAIEDLPNGQSLLDMYPESVAVSDEILVKGESKPKIYSLIVTLVTYGMVYNKDLFKKAGIVDASGNAKAPETWAEVRDAAKKITKPEEQVYGLMFPFKWTAYVSNELEGAWGASIVEPAEGGYRSTGKYTSGVEKKPMLEWWLSIRDDKTFYPGPEGIDNDPARATFANGQVGMKMAGSWDAALFDNTFVPKFDWGLVPYPVYDKNGPIYKQSLSTNSFLSPSNLPTSESKRPYMVDALKELYSVELQTILYQQGMNLPVAKKAYEDGNKNMTKMKGWKEFGDMMEISYKAPLGPSLQIEGDTTQAVYMKVWNNIMTIDAALEDIRQRTQAAWDKGVANGDIKPELYIDGFRKPLRN